MSRVQGRPGLNVEFRAGRTYGRGEAAAELAYGGHTTRLAAPRRYGRTSPLLGSVRRPGWGRRRRRLVVPVDALYIDGWDLELLLGPERYTIASSAQSSAAAPK